MPTSILMYIIQNENEIPAPAKNSELEERMEVCEKKIDKVFKYLTSFGGENE